jgi:hypothetical protein
LTFPTLGPFIHIIMEGLPPYVERTEPNLNAMDPNPDEMTLKYVYRGVLKEETN